MELIKKQFLKQSAFILKRKLRLSVIESMH